MATKSFLKSVSLRDPRQCKDFIRALEKSEQMFQNESDNRKTGIREMTAEQIEKEFRGKDGKADGIMGS